MSDEDSDSSQLTGAELFVKQQDYIQRMKNALRNFKKDSDIRYSHTYFKTKLNNLERIRQHLTQS